MFRPVTEADATEPAPPVPGSPEPRSEGSSPGSSNSLRPSRVRRRS